MCEHHLLIYITINKIFATMKHLVVPILSCVNVKTILSILRNLKQFSLTMNVVFQKFEVASNYLNVKNDIVILDSVSCALFQCLFFHTILVKSCEKIKNRPRFLKLDIERQVPGILTQINVAWWSCINDGHRMTNSLESK